MQTVAVLIPCFNEGLSIARVVREFRAQLPEATVYVYDNNSTDDTASEARSAGAVVRTEHRQGKGYVIQSMFKDIHADIYVLVDGDGTYPADRVRDLIHPIAEGTADMTIGSRLHPLSNSRFKYLNLTGNRLFLFLVNTLFRMRISDLLSGYRALSRHAVKSLPVLSKGFEVEAELTIKCLERGYRVLEIPVNLATRQEGSTSKIHIVKDGVRILNTIFSLTRDFKPLTVFGLIGIVVLLCGLAAGCAALAASFPADGIQRLLLSFLAGGLILSALLSFSVGLILHSLARRFQEQNHLLQNLPRSEPNDRRH